MSTSASSTAPVTPSDDHEQVKTEQPVMGRRRRRQTKSDGREFVGVAKGVDTGRFRTYSADKFVRAGSGLPDTSRPFTVLGIETSCDDTGVAVVRSDGVILGEALASQYKIHEQWGGVVPGLARDAHASVIDAMVAEALQKAGMTSAEQVDAVGVTVGPGLEICLRVGCETAKALAIKHQKPFVTIHHLEAHCLMARCGEDAATLAPFPFLALLVSGGHCMILEVRGLGQYRVLGGTLDDALGEAYDKAARLLKVSTGVAGGPAMEALARDGTAGAHALPVPMKAKKDLNFSYAGLKNAFRLAVERQREAVGIKGTEDVDLDHQSKADLAASFQDVAIRHLEDRLERAMQSVEQTGITTLAVVGGVAANQAIRSRIQALCEKRTKALQDSAPERGPWRLVVPPPRLCTDNGVMVAWAAVEKLKLGYSDAIEGQDVYARWPFERI